MVKPKPLSEKDREFWKSIGGDTIAAAAQTANPQPLCSPPTAQAERPGAEQRYARAMYHELGIVVPMKWTGFEDIARLSTAAALEAGHRAPQSAAIASALSRLTRAGKLQRGRSRSSNLECWRRTPQQ